MALVFAMMPLIVFYIGDILGLRLMRTMEASWLGWLPAILLIVLGTPFCWRELRR